MRLRIINEEYDEDLDDEYEGLDDEDEFTDEHGMPDVIDHIGEFEIRPHIFNVFKNHTQDRYEVEVNSYEFFPDDDYMFTFMPPQQQTTVINDIKKRRPEILKYVRNLGIKNNEYAIYYSALLLAGIHPSVAGHARQG